MKLDKLGQEALVDKSDLEKRMRQLAVKYTAIMEGFSGLFYKCRAGEPQGEGNACIKELRVNLGSKLGKDNRPRKLLATVTTRLNGKQAGHGMEHQPPDEANGFEVKFTSIDPAFPDGEEIELAPTEVFEYPGAVRIDPSDPVNSYEASDWKNTGWHDQEPSLVARVHKMQGSQQQIAAAAAEVQENLWPRIQGGEFRYPDLESTTSLELWMKAAEPVAADTLGMLMTAASDPALNPELAANIAAAP